MTKNRILKINLTEDTRAAFDTAEYLIKESTRSGRRLNMEGYFVSPELLTALGVDLLKFYIGLRAEKAGHGR